LGEAKMKLPTPITTGKSPDRMCEQNVTDHVVYAEQGVPEVAASFA